MARGLIYDDIIIYRMMMQLLYGGKYHKRMDPIFAILGKEKVTSVTELCFGDLLVADHCRRIGIPWHGIDGNQKFVKRAVKQGFDAQCSMIDLNTKFPEADALVMAGSFYHFPNDAKALLEKWLTQYRVIILCEPVRNWATRNSFKGLLAKRMTDAGKGDESFRFSEESLTSLVDETVRHSGYSWYIASKDDKDITLVILKNSI